MAVSATACLHSLIAQKKLPDDYLSMFDNNKLTSDSTPSSYADLAESLLRTSKRKHTSDQKKFISTFIKTSNEKMSPESSAQWNAFVMDDNKDMNTYINIQPFDGKEFYTSLVQDNKKSHHRTQREKTPVPAKTTLKTVRKPGHNTAGKHTPLKQNDALNNLITTPPTTQRSRFTQLISAIRKFNDKNKIAV